MSLVRIWLPLATLLATLGAGCTTPSSSTTTGEVADSGPAANSSIDGASADGIVRLAGDDPNLTGEEIYEAVGRAVTEGYAEYAHQTYSECVEQAQKLRRNCRSLTALPSRDALLRARKRFAEARLVYGKTEVFRFYDGPIDNTRNGVELLLNAWPLDEAFIEPVEGSTSKGIIGDEENFPTISKTILQLANERGGENNIAVGWHAIEFLLWGQDLYADSAGRRSHEAFQPATDPLARRRCEYLVEISELLIDHLEQVRDEWAPDRDDNYRHAFVNGDLDASLSNILRGLTILSAFELSGERLGVPYETQSQEDEHSCFSDLTHLDFIANQAGVRDVWRGRGRKRVGFREIAIRFDPELAVVVDSQIEVVKQEFAAIPPPFDQAIVGEDSSEGRRAVFRALRAVEKQADGFAEVAAAMGFDIPMQPGG